MRFNHYPYGQGHHRSAGRFPLEGDRPERFVRHRRGDPRGGAGGRGEGRRRFFERGEFKFALLELLAAEPMRGYQLIKAMEVKTGGLYSPSAGSIYPNLQLLEDMNLIDSAEEDGKKLYRITEEGQAYLRERGSAGEDRRGGPWERRGRHLPADGRGKHGLRGLMREWSDVIFLMADAAQAAQRSPSSAQAARFRELMDKLRQDLKPLTAADPGAAENAEPDEGSAPGQEP